MKKIIAVVFLLIAIVGGYFAFKFLNKYKLGNVEKEGYILVSGTNGKTTTTKMISHILSNNGFRVVHNKSGANLLNGIASTLLLDRNLFGNTYADIGVLEVDEFSLPLILKYIKPKVLVLLNLTRDQLDRYGEVDIICSKWQESLASLSKETVVVYDSTQENILKLVSVFSGKKIPFDDLSPAEDVLNNVGYFNVKNINASIAASSVFNLDKNSCLKNLKNFEYAYGRGEIINFKNISFHVFLAKNPASFNNNLKMLKTKNFKNTALWFILNDNIPDGRDVSWIYDIDNYLLKEACSPYTLFFSGKRAFDMAIRFHYAGLDVADFNIDTNQSKILEKIISSDFENVILFPNYSAMLDVRKLLTGRKIL